MPENIADAYPWVTTKAHAFKYNVHNFGPTLEPFNIGKWEPELEQGEFQVEEKSAKYTVYHSKIKHDPYLVVLKVEPFTFVFYMNEDESLAHWKQKYGYLTPAGLLKAFLPPEPTKPVTYTFEMDTRKAFFS